MIALLPLLFSYYIWDLAAATPRDTLCLRELASEVIICS